MKTINTVMVHEQIQSISRKEYHIM